MYVVHSHTPCTLSSTFASTAVFENIVLFCSGWWSQTPWNPTYDSYREPARRTWHRTLLKIRLAPPTEVQETVIHNWLRVGKMHGFSEFTQEKWEIFLQGTDIYNRDGVLPWERCAWRECICWAQHPFFRLCACKGCGRVYYCGRACQKRYVRLIHAHASRVHDGHGSDWKAGHRERCSRQTGGEQSAQLDVTAAHDRLWNGDTSYSS